MLGITLEDIQIKTSRFAKEENSALGLLFLDNPDEVNAESNENKKWPLERDEESYDNIPPEKVNMVVAERKFEVSSLLDETTGTYHCNVCEYDTQLIQKIRHHMKTRHERRFKCEHCEYASKQKSHVQLHMVSKHTGLRYNCDKCNFQTAHKKNVERHMESKHATDKKNKKYMCDICDFKTFIDRNLRIHKRKAHDIYIKEIYYKMAQLKKEIKDE